MLLTLYPFLNLIIVVITIHGENLHSFSLSGSLNCPIIIQNYDFVLFWNGHENIRILMGFQERGT